MSLSKPIAWITYDIEAGGPSPAKNSMYSYGMAAITQEKGIIQTWEHILKPLPNTIEDPDTMKNFWPKHPEAYKYSTSIANQMDPSIALNILCENLETLQKRYELVPIAWPAAFDWQWMNFYFHKFCDRNPLGYTSKCISSMLFMAGIMTNNTMDTNIDDKLIKKFIEPGYKPTHKPLDDALYQGMCMVNALNYYGSPKKQ